MNTLLRDLDAPTKSLTVLKEIIPEGSNIHSFFLFAGALEIPLAFYNRHLTAYTFSKEVHNFWTCALSEPARIAEIANNLFPPENEKAFYILQEQIGEVKGPFLNAALFFLLNRCSDRGTVSSGGMSLHNFTPAALLRLENFKISNFNVTHQTTSFLETFYSCDPEDYLLFPLGNFDMSPRYSRTLEKTTIPHLKLMDFLLGESKKWVTVYDFHPQLLELYEGKHIIMVDQFGRATTSAEKCKEVVIANL